MQAVKGYLHGSVSLSTDLRGKPRKTPIWVLRYRLPSGKDSRRTIGNAWTKTSRPPAGYLTRSQANAAAQRFLDEHADSVPEDRKTFRRAANDFLAHSKDEKGLRGSTLYGYQAIARRLGERPARAGQTWDERQLDTFSDEEIVAVRQELAAAKRSASTLNHYRCIVRGIFGTDRNSVALAWDWRGGKPESEDRIRFYEPDQIERLKAHAHDQFDRDIYTLAVEAGPRQSEIVGLKVVNCDFTARVIRFSDGFTVKGGEGGTKSHKVRSVPMSENVYAMLGRYCNGRPRYDSEGNSMYVFVRPLTENRPICGVSLYRRFISASRRAGLPPLRFHELRHTFGTQMARVVNITTLQAWMGHADIKTTMIYTHYVARPEDSAKITEVFGNDLAADNVVPLRATA